MSTDIYIFIMLLGLPLVFWRDGYLSIANAKFVFFLCATLTWAAFTTGVYAVRLIKCRYRRAPCFGTEQWLIVAFMLACCTSAALSPYPGTFIGRDGRYDGLVTWLLYGIIFLGVSALGRPRKLHLWAFALSISICCAVAMLQVFGLNPLSLYPEGFCYYDSELYSAGEFLSTIGNADLFSALLCLAIPLFSASYIRGHSKSDRLFLFPAMLSLLALLSSRVKGGILSIAVCAVFLLPFIICDGATLKRTLRILSGALFVSAYVGSFSHSYGFEGLSISYSLTCVSIALAILGIAALAVSGFCFRKKEPDIKLLRRCLLTGSALIAVLAAVLVYFLPFGGTASDISSVLHGNISDGLGSGRIGIWRRVLKLVSSRPFFGGGPDTIIDRLQIVFTSKIRDSDELIYGVVDNAHNEYLGILINLGLIALLTYIGALIISMKKALKGWNRSIFIPMIIPAVFCYLAQAFFDLGLCLVTPLFWLWWGLVEAAIWENGAPVAPGKAQGKSDYQ